MDIVTNYTPLSLGVSYKVAVFIKYYFVRGKGLRIFRKRELIAYVHFSIKIFCNKKENPIWPDLLFPCLFLISSISRSYFLFPRSKIDWSRKNY